jgi:hypothetical protein
MNEPLKPREHKRTDAMMDRHPFDAPVPRKPQSATKAAWPSLLPPNEAEELRSKWERIQLTFVEEPGKAVEDADKLVALAIRRVSEMLSNERERLEEQWTRGGEISTEDLRIALRGYRAFFSSVLSI